MNFPADYLHIKDWERLQYRGDRPLSWIKLPVGLLSDGEFLRLSRAERWDFLAICLASAAGMHPGYVANDPQTLRKCGAFGERLNLQTFIDKGLLEQNGATIREEKKRREKTGRLSAPPQPEPPAPLVFQSEFLSVTEEQDRALAVAFPWVQDRPAEYQKAAAWLQANPKRRVRNTARFVNGWFARIPGPRSPAAGMDSEIDLPAAAPMFEKYLLTENQRGDVY